MRTVAARRRWRSPVVVVLAVTLATLPLTAADVPPAPPQPARELLLKVVRADTGEPVPGVKGWYINEPSEGDGQRFDFDDKGEFRVPVAASAKRVRFTWTTDHFINGHVSLGDKADGPIPASYTIRLKPGKTIGGVVRDEKGQPVAGAELHFSFYMDAPDRPNGTEGAYGTVTTGDDGRWTFGGAPPRAPRETSLYVRHPDCIPDNRSQRLGPAQYDDLLAGKYVVTLRRGVEVTGRVVDDQGKPLAGAEVTDQSFGTVFVVKTDEAGEFKLRGVAPGRRQVVARAKGFAPQLRDVEVAEAGAATPPVELRLEKGRALRGRVVDVQGRPVAGAAISVGQWRGSYALGYTGIKSGDDGRFVWPDAPADRLTLSAYKADHPRLQDFPATAGTDQEYTLVLRPRLLLRGNVVDDATGKPIDKFKVTYWTYKNHAMWRGSSGQGSGGKFEVDWDVPGEAYTITVEAEGYLPSQSAQLVAENRNGGDEVVYDARLKRGEPITGVLRRPDGTPAAGADVILRVGTVPEVRDGRLIPRTGGDPNYAKADKDGRFTLPPRTGRVKILVIDESGWVEFGREANQPGEPVTLHAWSRVEGRLMKGDRPWPGQAVRLEPTVHYNPSDPDGYPTRGFFRYETTSDAEGKFAFDRVADGEAVVSMEMEFEENGRRGSSSTHGVPVTLQPGERRAGVQVGGVGRPVVGRVTLPPELKGKRPASVSISLAAPTFTKPDDWEALEPKTRELLRQQFEQSPAYRDYAGRVHDITAPIAADGTFRAEDVPPGKYHLWVVVTSPAPDDASFARAVASARAELTVAPPPDGKPRDDAPADAGTLALEMHHYLAAGDRAPDLDMPLFDGKGFDRQRLKLADLRGKGKYVLIDFWATWCGPCIAEMPTLARVHEQFGHDPRFAMVSISTDDNPDDPAKFLTRRATVGQQCWAGRPGEATAERLFGVHGIPSIWLVAPDGSVLAKDLRGDGIAQAVAKALREKK